MKFPVDHRAFPVIVLRNQPLRSVLLSMKTQKPPHDKRFRRAFIAIIAVIVIVILWPFIVVANWRSRGDRFYYNTNQRWAFEASQIVDECGDPVAAADIWRIGPFHMVVTHRSDDRLAWKPKEMWPHGCSDNFYPDGHMVLRGGDKHNPMPPDWR